MPVKIPPETVRKARRRPARESSDSSESNEDESDSKRDSDLEESGESESGQFVTKKSKAKAPADRDSSSSGSDVDESSLQVFDAKKRHKKSRQQESTLESHKTGDSNSESSSELDDETTMMEEGRVSKKKGENSGDQQAQRGGGGEVRLHTQHNYPGLVNSPQPNPPSLGFSGSIEQQRQAFGSIGMPTPSHKKREAIFPPEPPSNPFSISAGVTFVWILACVFFELLATSLTIFLPYYDRSSGDTYVEDFANNNQLTYVLLTFGTVLLVVPLCYLRGRSLASSMLYSGTVLVPLLHSILLLTTAFVISLPSYQYGMYHDYVLASQILQGCGLGLLYLLVTTLLAGAYAGRHGANADGVKLLGELADEDVEGTMQRNYRELELSGMIIEKQNAELTTLRKMVKDKHDKLQLATKGMATAEAQAKKRDAKLRAAREDIKEYQQQLRFTKKQLRQLESHQQFGMGGQVPRVLGRATNGGTGQHNVTHVHGGTEVGGAPSAANAGASSAASDALREQLRLAQNEAASYRAQLANAGGGGARQPFPQQPIVVGPHGPCASCQALQLRVDHLMKDHIDNSKAKDQADLYKGENAELRRKVRDMEQSHRDRQRDDEHSKERLQDKFDELKRKHDQCFGLKAEVNKLENKLKDSETALADTRRQLDASHMKIDIQREASLDLTKQLEASKGELHGLQTSIRLQQDTQGKLGEEQRHMAEESLGKYEGAADELRRVKAMLEQVQAELRDSERKLGQFEGRCGQLEEKVAAQDPIIREHRKCAEMVAVIEELKRRLQESELRREELRKELARTKKVLYKKMAALRAEIVALEEQLGSAKGDSDLRKKLIEDARARFANMRPQLGVEFTNGEGDGVRITDVFPDKPAEAGGLRVGDLVEAVNGEDTLAKPDFHRALTKIYPGDGVPFQINRNGVFETRVVHIGCAGFTMEEILAVRRVSNGIVHDDDIAAFKQAAALTG